METLSVSEARAQLSDLVNRVSYRGERVILTRHGRPVAVLAPVEEEAESPPSEDGVYLDVSASPQQGRAEYGLAARHKEATEK